ncbi:hypothetical protein [Streptomyces sp. NPDC007172]|uniref:hypothetical protein n=1 Tax=Streptomyces sp. NPDC007172 TaxID=3364776 RepID=UPI0036B89B1A
MKQQHTQISRRAQLLSLYTGLGRQSALRRVRAAHPGARLIPEPGAEQRLLEARIMAALAWRRISTLHPWGIVHVDPRPGDLFIRFESDEAIERGPGPADESMVADLAEVLLPRADEFGEVRGVVGARPHVENGQVVLRLLNSPARVVLSGLDPVAWQGAVDLKDAEQEAVGMTPCHRTAPDRLHAAERPYQKSRSRSGTAACAWLTSGLLRRAGLVRTLGVPYQVTGWMSHSTGGQWWVIDPTFSEGHGPRGHHRFMALLADPEWGVPLSVTDAYCRCEHDTSSFGQCTTVARCPAGRPGTLEVRAVWRRGDWPQRFKARVPEAYAARQQLTAHVPWWVDRWLERGPETA